MSNESKYMFVTDPKLAKEFASKTSHMKDMPEKKIRPAIPKVMHTMMKK